MMCHKGQVFRKRKNKSKKKREEKNRCVQQGKDKDRRKK